MYKRNVIMKILLFIACVFGYFGSSYFHIDVKIFLCSVGVLTGLYYIIESIRSKNGRIHIIVGILTSLLFVALLSHFIIIYEFVEYNKYQNYILFFTIMLIVLAYKICSNGYNKSANKSEKRFRRILAIIIIICIVIIIIEIILKKINGIP